MAEFQSTIRHQPDRQMHRGHLPPHEASQVPPASSQYLGRASDFEQPAPAAAILKSATAVTLSKSAEAPRRAPAITPTLSSKPLHVLRGGYPVAKQENAPEEEEWFEGNGLMRGWRYSLNLDYDGNRWMYETFFEFEGYAVAVRANDECFAAFAASEDGRRKLEAAGVKFKKTEDLPENLKSTALLYAALQQIPIDGEARKSYGVLDVFGNDMRLIENGGFVYKN